MKNGFFRKSTALFLACISACICCPFAAASAPGKQPTVTAAFSVDEGTPVAVLSENLTIRVDTPDEKSAQVTADYTIHNPTQQTVTVDMFLPVIGDMQPPQVTVDGAAVASTTTQLQYPHFEVSEQASIYDDISDVTALCSRSKGGVYQPKYFTSGDSVSVFTVKRNAKHSDTVVCPADSTLFAFENSSITKKGDTVQLQSDNTGDTYHVYLLHGDSLIVNSATIKPTSKMNMNQFAGQLKYGALEMANIDNLSYLNLIYCRVDQLIRQGSVITQPLLMTLFMQNINVLRYSVSFAPAAAWHIIVGYPIEAGYPSGNTDRTSFSTYAYLLKPAKNWASFENLKITVIPGPMRGSISSNSLPFSKNRDGSYSAVFKSLPSKDLSFALSHQLVLGDVTPQSVGVCALAIAGLVCILIYAYRHRSSEPEESSETPEKKQ